jgi:hypothetical protein
MGASTLRILGTLVVVGLWLCLLSRAAAQLLTLPDSLAEEALSEQVASADPPADFAASDFALVRVDGDEARAHAWLDAGSVRWVRTGGHAVVPRGILVVQAEGATGGAVAHAGFSHPLTPQAGGARALVPVALLSTDDASVVVDVLRGSVHSRVRYALRFRPRAQHRAHISFGVDCSPYGLSVKRGSIPAESWMHVSCRMVSSNRQGERTPTMELYVMWDHAAAPVLVNGVLAHERRKSLYTVRVSRGPGSVRLSAEGHELELAYFLPMQLRAAFVGAGVGPYYYTISRPEREVKTVVPMLTVYGGYSFTPTARVVFFNATAFHRRGFSDSGLYLWLEQNRFWDDRVSFNLLLGANLLVYHRVHKYVARVNAPQGVELIFRDFLAVAKNLTVGGFLYPDISGSAYYNAWLRWGSSRFFGEMNFLYWQEPHRTGPTTSTSVGLTFGMPLARFL